MLKYLSKAFWLRIPLAGLGNVPLNLLAILCAAIVGIAQPAVWLLGIGIETAYLFTLASNRRFQRLIDAQDSLQLEDQADTKRESLVTLLIPPAQKRLLTLQQRCQRIEKIYRDGGAEEFSIDSSREALRRLAWYYLKLLIAQQNMRTQDTNATERDLLDQVQQLEADVADQKISPSIRESKNATLNILRKRLDVLQRKEQALAEIDSDLMRIEAQVDLAMEQASVRGTNDAVSSNIDLVSQMLDDDLLYGESKRDVAALDVAYQQGKPLSA